MSTRGRKRIGAAVLMSAVSVFAIGLSNPAQAAPPVAEPAAERAVAGTGPVILPVGTDPEAANRAAVASVGASAAAARLGPYHIENVRSGKCAAIQNAGTANNALALQFTCDTVAPHNDDWYFDEIAPGSIYYHVVNRHSGKCLAIQNAGTADNNRALQFTCDSVAPHNDDWWLIDTSPDNIHVLLVNRHSGRCLTVQNASLSNNAALLQFGCEYEAPYNEQWRLL